MPYRVLYAGALIGLEFSYHRIIEEIVADWALTHIRPEGDKHANNSRRCL
jgi:hypothetical protein